MALTPWLVLVLAQAAPAADLSPEPVVGVVVDVAGKPVAEAEVVLAHGWPPGGFGPSRTMREQWSRSPFAGLLEAEAPVLARTRTDADGRFSLPVPDAIARYWEPVPVGLWASRPGSRPVGKRLSWVVPAPSEPVRLVLDPPASAAFRVVGPDGKPVASARLSVIALDTLIVPDPLAGAFAVVTDAQGRAVVTGFDPEAIARVVIEAPGLGRQLTTVTTRDAAGVRTIALEPVGRVAGRLVATGKTPAAGILVRAVTLPRGFHDGGIVGEARATTDAEGRFTIPAVAAGALVLALEFDPRGGFPERGQPPDNLVVAAGQEAKVEIPLKPALRLIGTVRDRTTHAPIEGVRVLTLGPDSDVTDAAGRFRASTVGHQTWLVPASLPRPYLLSATNRDLSGSIVGPDLRESSIPPIELTRGGTIRGRVVDDENRPVAGARVEAAWEYSDSIPQAVATRTKGDGTFVLDGVGLQIDLSLTAAHAGACTVRPVTARADADAPVTLRISLTGSALLAGRVQDADGQPIADAAIRIESRARTVEGHPWRMSSVLFEDRAATAWLHTDSDGRFRTPHAVPRSNDYQAIIRARGWMTSRSAWVQAEGGRGAILVPTVTLHRPRAIAGRVRDHQGRPVAGATVSQSGDGPIATRTTTDADGRFHLDGFLDGRGFVFVAASGFRFQGTPVPRPTEAVEVVLSRTDEPPSRTGKVLPSVLPADEERALARRLLDPYLAAVFAKDKLTANQLWAFRALAVVDPARALEMIDTHQEIGPDILALARDEVVKAVARDDPEEAAHLSEVQPDPRSRTISLLTVAGRLAGSDRDRARNLLAQALLNARAIPDPSQRLMLLGPIVGQLFDLGETDRATEVLREGQRLTRELPRGNVMLGYFARDLARIDLPAAEALIEQVRRENDRRSPRYLGWLYDRFRGGIAYRLAAQAPADAERILNQVHDLGQGNLRYPLAVCFRMAPKDLARARRLTARAWDALDGAYALGLMAEALAPTDSATAARLLDEAFDRIDRARLREPTPLHPAALVAAALLPVAERVAPDHLGEFLWRAVSFRPPRTDRGRVGRDDESLEAVRTLAMLVARYDRDTAALVLEPALAAARSQDQWFSAGAVGVALALIDPRRAVAFVESLPDDPGTDHGLPKNRARLDVAKILALHGEDRWREIFRSYSLIWRPGDPDEEL